MPEPTEQTAGTPAAAQDGGDAVPQEPTTGTPGVAPDGGDAAGGEEHDLEWWRREALRGKDALEETNRLKRRIEELETAVPPQPATGTPHESQVPQWQQEILETYADLQYRAAAGDKDAKFQLYLLNQQQQTNKTMQERDSLLRVPEADRNEAWRLYQSGRFADLEAAHQALLGQRYVKERDSIRKREAELKAEAEARQRGVVGVTSRPVPAQEAQAKRMAASEYAARMNGSPSDPAVQKLASDVAAGRVEIDYNK